MHKRRFKAATTLYVGFFWLVTVLSAQEPTNRLHVGVPQDWSQRHIVFSRDALLQHPNLIYQEPRVLHKLVQRWTRDASDASDSPGRETARMPSANFSSHRDWSFNLPSRVAANMFPAKFSFDPAAPPDCTNDYVVFGLLNVGVTGSAANLVAFHNLYVDSMGTGSCSGTSPNVMFAYNVSTAGGAIHTSPVLSLDGTKIAFIESGAGTSVFHVLTWTAGQGTPNAAAAPTMTSLTFAAANNTTSSPWVDYHGDVAYVAADDARVHKITGVFKGTPMEVTTAPWPITVSPPHRLTSPVLDGNLLLVGSADGRLYQINTVTGALSSVAVGKLGRTNPGLRATPILDITNGRAFVVSSNDGSSGVLVQVNTATLAPLATAPIGVASANTGGTEVNLYEPALSDSYFTNPSTGQIRLCGTGNDPDISPWLYTFGFDASGILQSSPTSAIHLTSSTAARCTPVTEFFNQNLKGGTDFFFLGITADCTGVGTSGCVVARSTGAQPAMVDITGGPSGIVVDNFSTAPQASSIYFMAAKRSVAYKLTQNGLQ
jgi:hypothetical protein